MDIKDIDDSVPQGVDEPSWADNVTSYEDLIDDNVFLGEVPLPTILESLDAQFSSYLKLEDDEDYVDLFYDQLERSYEELENNDEFHKDDLRGTLDKMYLEFIDHIGELFDRRFMIHIQLIEEGGDREELEDIIRQLYTFFVLNGRTNIRTAIAKDARRRLSEQDYKPESDNEYFIHVNDLMGKYYTPTLQMTPTEFLTYTNADDIRELYDTGFVSGNFLRKLSTRFYQYPEFQAEIVSFIMTVQDLQYQLRNPISEVEAD